MRRIFRLILFRLNTVKKTHNRNLISTAIHQTLPITINKSDRLNNNTKLTNYFTMRTNTTEKKDHKNELQSDEADFRTDSFDDPDDLASLTQSYSLARHKMDNKWLAFGKTCHIYLYRGGGCPKSCLAAFDLDGTIIKPKSNKRVPRNATDWQLFSVWTKVKLQQIVCKNEARFVIFTNQNGVGLKLVALKEVQERIELVTKMLDIPCTVFVATEKDNFRKPALGMFRLFQKAFNDSIEVDLNKSFYCGDAIGYPRHSDADIKFAQSLSLPFLPPEKFLRGVKPKLVLDEPSNPSQTP